MSLHHPRVTNLLVAATFLLAVLIASSTALAAGDDWRRFDSDAGHFSVEFPCSPAHRVKKRGVPIASFVSHVYTAWMGDDAFGVNHTDLPRVVRLFVSAHKLLDSARKGFLEDARANEVAYTETSVAGHPARELIYDIPAQNGRPPLRGTAHMLVEGKRLYIFWAEVTRTRAQADLRRFFHSIRLDERR